jgi:hypothetical protein
MTEKNFKLNAEDFGDLVPPMGGCIATDKITVDGLKVGYMYREETDDGLDSGWRFFQVRKARSMLMTLTTRRFTL